MRFLRMRLGLWVHLIAALSVLWPAAAAAEPGSGRHATVDQTFTTTHPNSPTGIGYNGRYHAAGDEDGYPPFMRRMVFTPPPGMRYDTSVPERCTASDFELSMNGPAACPAGSRLGGGTTEGVFFVPFTDGVVLDRYTHTVDVMNNAKEQIILIKAEGYAVVRGQFRRDGSIRFNVPTCFPTPPTGECVDDHVLQLGTTTFIPPYTKTSSDGSVRSYATTPSSCPASGHWTTTVSFWWSDGSTEDVATTQPCSDQ